MPCVVFLDGESVWWMPRVVFSTGFSFLVAQGHLCDGGKLHKMAKSARILGDACATTAPYSHNHVLTCVLY